MTAFKRINVLFAAMTAIAQGVMAQGPSATVVTKVMADQQIEKLAGGYESRGKGGKSPQRRSGIPGVKRAKVKAAGRALNKARHRG